MRPLNIYVCLLVEEEENTWHQQFTLILRSMGHRVFVPKDLGLRESWFALHHGLWGRRERERLTDKIFVRA